MITGSRRICAIDSSCRCVRVTIWLSGGLPVVERMRTMPLSGTNSALIDAAQIIIRLLQDSLQLIGIVAAGVAPW